MIIFYVNVAILVVAYNVFFNKRKPGGTYGGYSYDPMPIFRGLLSVIIALVLCLVVTWIAA